MEDNVPFASRAYFVALGILVFARGMDFLSTWVATPNLMLEGNPIAKKLGWKWGAVVNALFCGSFALWPLPAMVLSTTSILVAARNFQQAWLMRSLGEEAYRDWHIERIQETHITLYLLCLAGNTVLTAIVGAAVIYFSNLVLIPFAIGVGIMGYAAAVAFYTLLAIWRMRRNTLRHERQAALHAQAEAELAAALKSSKLAEVCLQPEVQ